MGIPIEAFNPCGVIGLGSGLAESLFGGLLLPDMVEKDTACRGYFQEQRSCTLSCVHNLIYIFPSTALRTPWDPLESTGHI